MERVQMIIGGKLASVPAEHAKSLAKKEMLVARAAELNTIWKTSNNREVRIAADEELSKLIAQIQRINRKLPACVQFANEYKAFA